MVVKSKLHLPPSKIAPPSRSVHAAYARTESLSDTRDRVDTLWQDELQPAVQAGFNVLVVGHANCLRALISCIQPISDAELPSLGVPNALPLVYMFDDEGGLVVDRESRCYVSPLSAHYLGDACVLFSELDTDGSGALDKEELNDTEYCQLTEGIFDAGTLECGAQLLSEADGNNDGVVDFNEFMNWSSKLEDKSRARGRGGGGSGAGLWRE